MRTLPKLLSGSLLTLGFALVMPAGVASAQRAPNPRVEAQKQIRAAQAQVNEIKAEQKRIKDKLMAEFESKEEWKNTISNHRKAEAAYNKARKNAERATIAKPAYKELAKEREALRLELEELQNARNPDPDAITRTATELTERASKMKKMETETVANDEKVLAAKEEYEKAQKDMDALEEEVEGALMSDPDYLAIQQQLDQAEGQVKQMREQLAQQTKSEQQSRAAAGRAAAEARRAARSSRGAEGAQY